MQVRRRRVVLLLEREGRIGLDQGIRELEAAAREHREVVAGTELIFRHQHPSPPPPQLLHGHQADPQLEPEAGAGEAPGAAERIRDHAAHPRRDEHGRAIAAERVREVQLAGHVQHRGDAGGPHQVDILVAPGARRLRRALDVGQHHDPVVRGRDVARRIGDLGKLGERFEPGIEGQRVGPVCGSFSRCHGLSPNAGQRDRDAPSCHHTCRALQQMRVGARLARPAPPPPTGPAVAKRVVGAKCLKRRHSLGSFGYLGDPSRSAPIGPPRHPLCSRAGAATKMRTSELNRRSIGISWVRSVWD